MELNQVLIGDNRQTLKSIPDSSIDCCITSPPYWGLRDYGADGQIGLEQTPGEYIAELASVFSEVKRVLADHGTLWLNIGETYSGSWGAQSRGQEGNARLSTISGGQCKAAPLGKAITGPSKNTGRAPKNMLGIPWRLAFALQDAGWVLRQDIIWEKPSPMPSSVRDRCTTAHEYLFLLAKRRKYFYDWYAISEPCSENTHSRGRAQAPKALSNTRNGKTKSKQNAHFQDHVTDLVDRRNKRSVWTIPAESYSGQHFAAFPRKLVEPCILAGCPETVCLECGKPWVRVVDSERRPTRPGEKTKLPGRNSRQFQDRDLQHSDEYKSDRYEQVVGNRDAERHVTSYIDRGFHAACQCGGATRRGRVLDPFLGSGTTAQVAQDLGRDWIGCEICEAYTELQKKRLQQMRLPL